MSSFVCSLFIGGSRPWGCLPCQFFFLLRFICLSAFYPKWGGEPWYCSCSLVPLYLSYHFSYSRTSRKRPLKMSSLGSRFREVVAYKSLDIGSKIAWLAYGNCRDLPWFQENHPVLPFETFPSLVLPRNVIMLQHFIQFPLYYDYYLWSGRLRRLKKKKIST